MSKSGAAMPLRRSPWPLKAPRVARRKSAAVGPFGRHAGAGQGPEIKSVAGQLRAATRREGPFFAYSARTRSPADDERLLEQRAVMGAKRFIGTVSIIPTDDVIAVAESRSRRETRQHACGWKGCRGAFWQRRAGLAVEPPASLRVRSAGSPNDTTRSHSVVRRAGLAR